MRTQGRPPSPMSYAEYWTPDSSSFALAACIPIRPPRPSCKRAPQARGKAAVQSSRGGEAIISAAVVHVALSDRASSPLRRHAQAAGRLGGCCKTCMRVISLVPSSMRSRSQSPAWPTSMAGFLLFLFDPRWDLEKVERRENRPSEIQHQHQQQQRTNKASEIILASPRGERCSTDQLSLARSLVMATFLLRFFHAGGCGCMRRARLYTVSAHCVRAYAWSAASHNSWRASGRGQRARDTHPSRARIAGHYCPQPFFQT